MTKQCTVALLDLPVPPNPHPYLARMARFSNDAIHEVRRQEVLAVLPASEGLEAATFDRMTASISYELDVMPLLSSVPVAVLCAALHCCDHSEEVSLLCEEGIVSDSLPDLARTSLLFQCRDATAALAVTVLANGTSIEAAVPVTRTRREGVGWVDLSATPFGAGRHRCPGRSHALAMVRGILAALEGHEIMEEGPDVGRQNLRLPSYLIMGRRGR